ncbi:MAG: beta strand repeat-containing protein, partial [Flexibacteraceae bacterium]
KSLSTATVTFISNSLTVLGVSSITRGTVIPNGNLVIGASGNLAIFSLNGIVSTNSPSYVSGSRLTYSGSGNVTVGSELNTTTNLSNINISNTFGVRLADNVVLASGTALNLNTNGILIAGTHTISGAGSFVLNGGTLRTANTAGLGATLTTTTTTFTSGTIAFNAGTAQDFGTITNTGSALVTFAGTGTTLNIASGTYTVRQLNVTSGNTFTLSSGATLALTSETSLPSLTVNGTGNFNGTVVFQSAGTSQNIVHTISGNSIAFNNVTISGAKTGEVVGLSASAEYLVNGELQINRGGYIGTPSPSYGASSTLIYNIGEAYGRGAEWNSFSGVQGYPVNVILRGSGTNLGVSNSAPTVSRNIRGNLTVENGATFSTNGFTSGVVTILGNATVNNGGTISMGSATAFLNVNGSIEVQNGGTLTLSSAIGGDLGIGTNFTLGSSATFTHNTRELAFYGSNNSVISGGGGTLGFMHINKTTASQTVTCNTNLNIANRIRFTNGTMNPNGFLTINNGASVVRTTANGTFSSAPTYVAGSIISYEGTTAYSTSSELPSPTTNVTTINVTNTSGVTLSGNIALATGTTLNLSSGILATNGNVISGTGTFNLNGGTLRLSNTGGIAATLTGTTTFNSGTIDFNSGGTQSYGAVNGLSNINIAAINNTTVNLDGSTSMRTLFTGPGSTFSAGTHTITITTFSDRQSFINNGTFVPGTSTVVFAGGGSGVEHLLVGTIPFHNVT